MKILKKILAFTTTLVMSVSAMAMTMTASATQETNYEYNGKTYDIAYINERYISIVFDKANVAFFGDNFITSMTGSGGDLGTTVDVYDRLTVNGILNTYNGEPLIINVMPGSVLGITDLVVADTVINNYGGVVNLPVGATVEVNEMVKEITPDTTDGKNTNTINATTITIPAPTYTVTIPEEINFGTQDRALKNDSDEKKIATTTANLTYTAKNLDLNEKILTVTVSQINPLTAKVGDTNYSIDYALTTDGTEISAGTQLVNIVGTENDNEITETEIPITATFDKSDIEVEAEYTGSVIFTVALTDEE